MSYLLGPSLFTVMKANNGNIIYMFGEDHSMTKNLCEDICKSNKCYKVDDFIEDIFKDSNNHMVSFDIEVPRYFNAKYHQNTFLRMADIYDKFYDELFGSNKKYKNVYLDKIDIRLFISGKRNKYSTKTFDTYTLFSQLDFKYVFEKHKGRKKYLENIYEFINIFIKDDIYLKLIMIYIFSDNFINDFKETLSKYKNIHIRYFLYKNLYYLVNFYQIKNYSITGFVFNKLKNYDEVIYNKIKDFAVDNLRKQNYFVIKYLTDVYNNEISYVDLSEAFISMLVFVEDLHVLTTYFLNKYNYFDYNIFYFGSAHIRNYFKFFTDLGFQKLYYKESKYKNCVNITKYINPVKQKRKEKKKPTKKSCGLIF